MSSVVVRPEVSSSRPAARIAVRIATLGYGLVAYSAFGAVFAYAIGFVGNWVVPKSIDSGAPGPWLRSLIINAALLTVFVLQHTVMARPAFKRWITQYIPASIERSTFVIAASASLALAFWQWQPLPQVVWDVGGGVPYWLLTGLSLAGYAIVFAASCMVSHFDLFGLRQVWFGFLDKPYVAVGFRLIGLYKLVRHPLMLGFFIAFWSTPRMTVGHLAFSLLVSAYIFMGTWFEERDLIAEHGEKYLKYRRAVRGFVPLPVTNTARGA